MARIRSIHPSLYTDEDFMSLSPYAMVAWPGLWVEADDQGVIEWKPLTLKARLLPCAAVDMSALLAEYEERGMLKRFEASGKAYGAIRNFRKFQRPEKPKAWHPLPDDLRPFVGLSSIVPEAVTDRSPTAPRKSPQMEDGGGECSSEANASGAAEPAPKDAENDPEPEPAPDDPEKAYFNTAAMIDGTKGFRGQAAQLLNLCDGDVAVALRKLQTCFGKRDPKSWLAGTVNEMKGRARGSPTPRGTRMENGMLVSGAAL